MSKKKEPKQQLMPKGVEFGRDRDPREAQKASVVAKLRNNSIRDAIRRLGAIPYEIIMNFNHKEIADYIAGPGATASAAHMVAARKFLEALNGDTKAMKDLEESIDGKLVERVMEAQVTLADLVTGDGHEFD